ncbi:Hsp20/alpha crystallin family protein [Desertibacillus haloalkaliphilus]|uniref:Hsp20/alpha crystallin family protein n=1 Tax=Desertibacillus haloalkaliphilus TaxID=1328930 RepID=UPI001C25338D|nr:Hsp20/alpha crystallin family protein [Desertibacillus haloalkaliphilus]MBU8906373.1 Hsp20/alpha crystallin family protein [Desertibacillus haloalkaliphilus]
MNNYLPNNWKDMLPKFLGDDFFSNFENLANDNSPAKVNIYETGNELLCVFSLPGLKLEDVDIYAYERTLEVRGSVHVDFSGFRLIQEEIPQGPFKRTLELPYPVRDDKVDAAFQRGLLVIHLHRLIRSNQAKQKINIKNLDEE